MALTGLSSLSANTRSSPFAENFSPSFAESSRPLCRARKSNSVVPNVPAARTTIGASIRRLLLAFHRSFPTISHPLSLFALPPPPPLGLGYRLDPVFAEHRCAMIDRIGNVCDPYGVLCAHIATRLTVSAIPAGVLHHACNVRSRTMGDRHRRQLHRTARRFCRLA